MPDIVFKDYVYQLVDYYPNANRATTAGRRLSQRFGIVGRAWRLRQSMGRGIAVSDVDGSNQLIMYWGMQRDEADDQTHLRPANLCVMLIDPEDNDNRVGLLYVDSTVPNAFGINPPLPPAAAAVEAAVAAALAAAGAVADAAADAAAQRAVSPAAIVAGAAVAQAAREAVAQATADAVPRATADAAAQAAARAAAEITAHAAAEAAAEAVAQAATAAAGRFSATPEVEEVAVAVATAAVNAVARATADAAAQAATAAAAEAITADQVAEALQNHALTRVLAHAVGQAMAPLRSAGPQLDVTNPEWAARFRAPPAQAYAEFVIADGNSVLVPSKIPPLDRQIRMINEAGLHVVEIEGLSAERLSGAHSPKLLLNEKTVRLPIVRGFTVQQI